MKPITIAFSDGKELKLGIFTKIKGVLRVHRLVTVSALSEQNTEDLSGFSLLEADPGVKLDTSHTVAAGITPETGEDADFAILMRSDFSGVRLHETQFVALVTEPYVYYVPYSKPFKDKKEIAKDLKEDINLLTDHKYDFNNFALNPMADSHHLVTLLEQEIPVLRSIKNLARINGRKRYNIHSVKTAELSMAHYIATYCNYGDDENTLVVNFGADVSRLLFMQGKKLKHIGAALDVKANEIDNISLYLSKILLEMENGGIPKLDHIVLSGKFQPEIMIDEFSSLFPTAIVESIQFPELSLEALHPDKHELIVEFGYLIATAFDVLNVEKQNGYTVNLLPRSVIEEQKVLQFGWHTFAVLPLLFLVTLWLTTMYVENKQLMLELDQEIQRLTVLKIENTTILSQIDEIDQRINNFDQTQSLLDEGTRGAEQWTKFLSASTNYLGNKRSVWYRTLNLEDNNTFKLEGHATNRKALTEFSDFLSSYNSLLKNIKVEQIGKTDVFRYTLILQLPDAAGVSK